MPGPAMRRRQLGKELRRLRESADKLPKEAAEYLGVSTSTISKIENGKQAAQLAHVRLLLIFYGVESPDADALVRLTREANQRGWWSAYGDTVPDWFRDYVSLEGDVAALRSWDPELIHGLLQAPDYTRAIRLASAPTSSPAEVQRSVDLRKARQDRLDADNPPEVHAVIGEGAVRRQVGGPLTLADQLDHLVKIGERDNVTIQVLPFDCGAHPAMVSPFTLLRFPDEQSPAAVYLENDRGATYQERPSDIKRYIWMFDELTQAALTPEDSSQLLSTLGAHLREQ